jgi:hypothetical protein
MRETWLRTNRRALGFGTVPPALLAILGMGLVARGTTGDSNWLTWLGVTIAVLCGGLVAAILMQMRVPRVAYQNGEVFFNLRSGPPIAVPVELVEAFFIGQGPLMIPGSQSRADATVNLVARISQRDPSYAEREVKPALGRWSESYVTIRGTWCEPLNGELVRRLNHRLREVTEERESSTTPAPPC